MNEFIEKFRIELAELANYRDTTIAAYITAIYSYESYARDLLGIKMIQSKPTHLNSWFASLRDTNKYGTSFLNMHKVAVKKFFDFLKKLAVINKNPAEHLPSVKGVQRDLKKIISNQSIRLLLDLFDKTVWIGMRNYIIVSMLWALGLRAAELTVIKLKDINLNYNPDQRIGLIKIHGKGRKERTLFIVGKLYDELIRYLKYPESPGKKHEPLICNRSIMKPLTAHRIWQIIKEAAHKAGITERVTPHLFRHTFATDMYHKNVPVEAIMDMLGHNSISETSCYIHVSEKLRADALSRLSTTRKMS